MASVKLNIKTNLKLDELRKEIVNDLKRRVRNNLGDARPFVEDAINAAVETTKDEFIPDDREIAELGVGSDGSPDIRVNEAYKQLRTDNPGSVTRFSIRKSRGSETVGVIKADIDEDLLFESSLAKIPTPGSDKIKEIPWLRWLIEGAPTNPDYRFLGTSRSKTSRTGMGIMVKGGVWLFPPGRPDAFGELSRAIEGRIVRLVEENIGEII